MPESDVRQLFYRNGQVHREEPCCGDLVHGTVRVWHKNGVLASEAPHIHGLPHGICRQWGEQGRLLGSFEMVHGTGIQREWHDNAQLKLEISTLDGEFTGRSRTWLRDGTLSHVEYFVNNESVSREQYHAAASSDARFPRYDESVTEVVPYDPPTLKRMEHDLFVQALLQKPNQTDARQWLAPRTTKPSKRNLGDFPDELSAATFVDELLEGGVLSVIAADIYFNQAQDQFCDSLLVQLPVEPTKRANIRPLCRQLCQTSKAAFQPDEDIQESYLFLLFS